jgi:hypothetical protein
VKLLHNMATMDSRTSAPSLPQSLSWQLCVLHLLIAEESTSLLFWSLTNALPLILEAWWLSSNMSDAVFLNSCRSPSVEICLDVGPLRRRIQGSKNLRERWLDRGSQRPLPTSMIQSGSWEGVCNVIITHRRISSYSEKRAISIWRSVIWQKKMNKKVWEATELGSPLKIRYRHHGHGHLLTPAGV